MVINDLEQLKEFRNKAGVYIFIDKKDESKRYVGKSINLYQRIGLQHKNSANPKNSYIDRTIKKHGLFERFRIELIHWWEYEVNNIELLALEAAAIIEYGSIVEKGGYNICLFSNDNTGRKLSQEHKKNISLGHPRLRGKLHHNFGRIASKETRIKMSDLRSGKYHHLYGFHHSQETRNKISRSCWGRKHSKETIEKIKYHAKRRPIEQLDKETRNIIKVWVSITEAAQFIKNIRLSSSPQKYYSAGICGNLSGRYTSAYGFSWKYVNTPISV